MELREALTQIAEIRRQMAKAEVFQGYRSTPVAFSGTLALVGGVVQPLWAPEPARDIGPYLTLWIGVAALSVAAVAVEMALRWARTGERMHAEPTRLAVEQFVPALAAGVLVTAVIVRHAPGSVALLPGLWQILFSLGIFASVRLLPRAVLAIGCFYFTCGVLVLMASGAGWALSPWCMGLPFGIGQLASAAILYWTLERRA